jgi:hypothetical protein
MILARTILALFVLLTSHYNLVSATKHVEARDTTLNPAGIFGLFRRLTREKKDVIECDKNEIWTLMGSDLGKTACSELFNSPNATITATGTLTEYL